MLDWLKMLCRKLVKVDANICDNRSVIEGDHNTDNKLDVENSALKTLALDTARGVRVTVSV